MDANKDKDAESSEAKAIPVTVDDVRPVEPPTEEVAPAPSEEPEAPAEPKTAAASEGADTTAEKPENDNPMAITSQPAKHSSPKGTIIVALAVAILLAVLAVMVFIKTNKADAPSVPAANQSNNTPAATTEDVDQTTEAIDAELKAVDEATDFGENDLSDSTLQL